jgi:hypothetical protein
MQSLTANKIGTPHNIDIITRASITFAVTAETPAGLENFPQRANFYILSPPIVPPSTSSDSFDICPTQATTESAFIPTPVLSPHNYHNGHTQDNIGGANISTTTPPIPPGTMSVPMSYLPFPSFHHFHL